jgi:hypothetical protein
MFGRVTEKDANSGPVSPFVVGLLALQGVVQDVNRGAEGMKLIEIRLDFGSRKFGDRRTVILGANDASFDSLFRDVLRRKGVTKVDVIFQGCRPQGHGRSLRRTRATLSFPAILL